MSKLREQLQAMKREYRSAKYPGDLAAELLAPPARPIMRIAGWSATISAIAAAIVLWVTLRPAPAPAPQTPQGNQEMAAVTGEEEIVAAAEEEVIEVESFAEMGGTPAFPSDMSFTPSETSMEFPSTFTFPSMSMDFVEEEQSTSEESA